MLTINLSCGIELSYSVIHFRRMLIYCAKENMSHRLLKTSLLLSGGSLWCLNREFIATHQCLVVPLVPNFIFLILCWKLPIRKSLWIVGNVMPGHLLVLSLYFCWWICIMISFFFVFPLILNAKTIWSLSATMFNVSRLVQCQPLQESCLQKDSSMYRGHTFI